MPRTIVTVPPALNRIPPFPLGRKERIGGDGLDVEIFDARVLDKSDLADAAGVAGRSMVFNNGQFSGDGIHDEVIPDDVGLVVVIFGIARQLQPRNSGSCVGIGLAAFPENATYLPAARYASLHKHHRK